MPIEKISEFALSIGFVTTLMSCILLVMTTKWHGRFTLDGTEGVQKSHHTPTPRIGGIAILMGLLLGWELLPKASSELLGAMIIAGLPAFFFGIAEDLTKRVGIIERLIATMVSGMVACWLTGISLTRIDVWGIDQLLTLIPISILFTAFAVGGVANAINIIDGFNGLASGTIMICLTSIGVMAGLAGDVVMVELCALLVAVTLGFLLVNFPLGKIFLGDGGAYLLGFLMAWLAVMLPARNPDISPWASLTACGYPILEVLFSMARRAVRNRHPGHPDRLHLHSLVRARIAKRSLAKWPAVLQNASVSPMIWMFAIVPAIAAVIFRENTAALVMVMILVAVLYAFWYARLIYFRWCIPRLIRRAQSISLPRG